MMTREHVVHLMIERLDNSERRLVRGLGRDIADLGKLSVCQTRSLHLCER